MSSVALHSVCRLADTLNVSQCFSSLMIINLAFQGSLARVIVMSGGSHVREADEEMRKTNNKKQFSDSSKIHEEKTRKSLPLLRTVLFVPGESPYILSKFNPLNTDTPLLRTVLFVPGESPYISF